MTDPTTPLQRLIEEAAPKIAMCIQNNTMTILDTKEVHREFLQLLKIAKGAQGLRQALEKAELKLARLPCPQGCTNGGISEDEECQWCGEMKREWKALQDFDSLLP